MKYTTSALLVGFIASSKAETTPFVVPNSEVMRAIADANTASLMEKTDELNKVARQMEKLENTAKVNKAINKSTSDEESSVIEASNKRMSDIHLKKESEANKSAEKLESIKAETKASFTDADNKEIATTKFTLGNVARTVIGEKPLDEVKVKINAKKEKSKSSKEFESKIKGDKKSSSSKKSKKSKSGKESESDDEKSSGKKSSKEDKAAKKAEKEEKTADKKVEKAEKTVEKAMKKQA